MDIVVLVEAVDVVESVRRPHLWGRLKPEPAIFAVSNDSLPGEAIVEGAVSAPPIRSV